MNPLLKILRGAEWWSYKIPPILAIAYAMILVDGSDPRPNLLRMLAGIVSIIAVAAYGYVINDCFDIEVDRKAGKFNGMARRSIPERAAILAFILAVGWVPSYLTEYSAWACLFLLLDFLLPTIYSIPPIRLKERGVLGVLSDASAAHLLPTLFFAALLLGHGPEPNARAVAFTAVAAGWYSLVGLRGILNHQILDREGDLAAGVETFVTAKGQIASLLFTRRVLYSLEIAFVILVVLLLRPISTLIFPVFVAYLLLELTKRALGWDETFVVGQSVDQNLRRYLPFANNIFYNLWLPSILAIELAWEFPNLWFVPLAHLALFGTRWRHEHREPLDLLRDAGRRGYRRLVQWSTGWTLQGSPTLWPRVRRSRRGSSHVRVLPRSTSAQPSDVKILSGRLPIAQGSAYRLTFRARADQPRGLTIGVGQRFAPFQELGLTREIRVHAQPRSVVFDMIAPRSDRNGCIFIWLGGSDIPFDIESTSLECVSDPWFLSTFNGARAEREIPPDPRFDTRVECLDPSTPPWDVLLRYPHRKLFRQACLCQVRVRMRSDVRRLVTFGLIDANDHTSLLGVGHDVVVTPTEEEFVALVPIDRPRPVDVFFWLGGSAEAVEISRPLFDWLPADRYWHVDSATPGLLRCLPSDHRASFRLAEPTSESTVPNALWRRIDPRSMNAIRVQVMAKVSQGSALLSIGILKVTRDGMRTIAKSEARLHDREEPITVDAVIDEPHAEYRVYVWLPPEPLDIELSPPCVMEIGTNQVWHLWTEVMGSATRHYRDPSTVELEVHPAGAESWGVRLTSDTLPPSTTSRQISFRIRSLCERAVPVGACQQNEPWTPMGGMIMALLSPEWHTIIWDIPPTERETAVTLMLGEISGVVEVTDLCVTPLEGAAWRWEFDPPALAIRTEVNSPGVQGRVDVKNPGERKEDVKIVSPLGPVTEGDLIRVDLPLRADEKRNVLIGIQGSQEPWRSLGEWRAVSIDSTLRTYAVELSASTSATDGRVAVAFGQRAGALEWGPSNLRRFSAHRQAWRLWLSDDSIAYTSPTTRPDALRVSFLATSASPFDVKLVLPVSTVSQGKWYRARIQLRATEPRDVTLGLFQGSSPWNSLGWIGQRSLGPEWTEFVADFQAETSNADSVFLVACGNSTIPVEASDARLIEIEACECVRIIAPERAVTQTVSSHDGFESRRFQLTQALPVWDAKVLWSKFALSPGKYYRLQARLRADGVRPLTLAVGQIESPWNTTGPVEVLELTPADRSVVVDFIAKTDDARNAVWLCLGGSLIPVDVTSASVLEIPIERFWRIAVGGQHISRASISEPEPLDQFTIVEPSPDPWSLKMVSVPRPLARGRSYRLRCKARSTTPISITLCFVQEHPPWSRVGNLMSITTKPDWATLVVEMEADADDVGVTPTIFWGAREGTLEIADLRWTESEPTTSSTDARDQGCSHSAT